MPKRLSKTARAALTAVTGKRARIVVDHILKHGSITTDELKNEYGYDHPPRAIKDVSDQGIPLIRKMVRKSDGKRMAEYRFGDLNEITLGRIGGRIAFPKAFKKSLISKYGGQCAICNASLEPRYLQIDHRIPYLVAGDKTTSTPPEVTDFMLLCSSCNRAKSWSCEHCPNGTGEKNSKVCTMCYWANPHQYTHVATADIRRLDLTWMGAEVSDFDKAKAIAGDGDGAMPNFVKNALRRAVRRRSTNGD